MLAEFYQIRSEIFGIGSFLNGPDSYDLYPSTKIFVFYDNQKVVGGLRIIEGSDGPLAMEDKFGRTQQLVPNIDLKQTSHCEISGVCAIQGGQRAREYLGTTMQKIALDFIRAEKKSDLVFIGLRTTNIGPAHHAVEQAKFKGVVISGKGSNIHDIQRVPMVATCNSEIKLAEIVNPEDKPQSIKTYHLKHSGAKITQQH